MTATIWGPLTDRDGIAHWDDGTIAAEPTANFNTHQPRHIPIDIGHDGNPIGDILYLEESYGKLHAVGVIDTLDAEDLADAGDVYWSSTTLATRARHRSYERERIELRSITLTKSPAGHGLAPLHHLPGDIRDRDDRTAWTRSAGWNSESMPAVIRNAIDYLSVYTRAHGPLIINRPLNTRRIERTESGLMLIDGEPVVSRAAIGAPFGRAPWGAPIEHRPAQVISVR